MVLRPTPYFLAICISVNLPSSLIKESYCSFDNILLKCFLDLPFLREHSCIFFSFLTLLTIHRNHSRPANLHQKPVVIPSIFYDLTIPLCLILVSVA